MRREPLAPDALDNTDRHILNRLQEGFPITGHPFDEAGKAFGLTAEGLIARLRRLREIGAITRFGPFYDTEAMGGAFCLCAMAVPEEDFQRVMTLVNAHDEVAHNYERIHRLNMWFVLACESEADIGHVSDRIALETGMTVHRFPKLKEFYIGFRVSV